MNANQIINMVLRMVMRQVMRRGVNAGMDALANRKKKTAEPDDGAPRQASHNTAEAQQRMRQSMRAVKRINRF